MVSQPPKRLHKLPKTPFGLFLGVMLGILTGHFFPEFAEGYGHLGEIFISLMKLCIIPIIFTSVSLSIATFLMTKSGSSVGRYFLIFLIVLVATSSIGYLVSIATHPGYKLDTDSSAVLKELSLKNAIIDREMTETINPKIGKGFKEFILEVIPQNIFSSVTKDKFLQVIVFSFLFGIILTFVSKQYSQRILPLLESLRAVFEKLFWVITYGLPIAIFFIIARDTTTIGGEVLFSMAGFVVTTYIAIILVFIVNSVILSYRTRTSFFKSLAILKEPLFISVAAHSSIAAIPAAIEAMRKGFKLDPKLVDMLVPIGTVLGQYGTLLYFTCATVFVSQFYQIELGFTQYLVIVLASIIATMSTIGAGPLKLPLLALVLDSLDLPISAVLILFSTVDLVIMFGASFISVHTNCAAISLMLPRPKAES